MVTPQRDSSASASSTRSRESAARSSGRETSGAISSTPTPSCSATTRRTSASYVSSMIIAEKDAGRETPWGDEAGAPPRVAHACDLSAGLTRTVRAFDARARRCLHSDVLRQMIAQHAEDLDGDDEPGREDERDAVTEHEPVAGTTDVETRGDGVQHEHCNDRTDGNRRDRPHVTARRRVERSEERRVGK